MSKTTLLMASALAAFACSGLATAATLDVSFNPSTYSVTTYGYQGDLLTTNTLVPMQSQGGTEWDNVNTPPVIGLWTATYSFDLPTTGYQLVISNLAANDSAVVELNGTIVDAAGIFGSSSGQAPGYFIFSPTGTAQSQKFYDNYSQYNGSPLHITAPLTVGSNTLEIFVDNTGNGIRGNSFQQGSTSLLFTGDVTNVPEPRSWAFLILGFGFIGVATRWMTRHSAAKART